MANPLKGSRRTVAPGRAREEFLERYRSGMTVADCLAAIARSTSWYEEQRRKVPQFRDAVDQVRILRRASVDQKREAVGEFEDFRRKYLKQETFPHQRLWIDLLEERPLPEDIHPSIVYEPSGDSSRILINTPPNHAKSRTITVDYVMYMIAKDPGVRIVVVSKTQKMAMQFMYSVKRYMTHPEFTALQLAFGPPDGWKASADQWRADAIYTGGDERVGVEKDPTLQALGMGGQIYGVRSKLIVLDDCVTLSNAHEWEKQMDWIRQEVSSRLDPFGKLLVVGTRVAPQDLYRELRNEDHYTDGFSPWTYLAQPAVLEMPDPNDPTTWITLWPESHVPFEGSKEDVLPNGNYSRWTGPRLKKIRNDVGPARWAMVYQQLDVSMEATFNAACVRACVNGMRKAGPLNVASPGHPPNIDGFVTICALDPAFTGFMAAIALAIDPSTGKRYVLDVKTLKNQTTVLIHETIQEFTERYRPREWIIEQNAAQLYFLNDPWLTKYLRTKGVTLRGHFCVDTDTEVLSDRGWLRHDEVNVGDSILTLNIASERSEWKPVLDKYVGAYYGPMHEFGSRSINALCTPDHKWPRTDQAGSPMALVASQDLNTNSVIPRARLSTHDPAPTLSDDLVELVCWAVTEGNFRPTGTSIRIGQSESANPDHCETIRLLLKRMGAQWREYDNGCGTQIFSVRGEAAKRVRAVTNNGKFLTPEFAMALTASQRTLALRTLVDADGWTQGKTEYLCSDEPSILDAYEMLCALEGNPTYRTVRKDDPGHGIVSRRFTRDTYLQNVGCRPKVVEWEGTVWCPSTENGTFYARRGGTTYFTGNTGRNKQDPDFGVASMAPLFGSMVQRDGQTTTKHAGDQLIELPDQYAPGIKELVEQLITWSPAKKTKHLIQDTVMALWFAELAAREVLISTDGKEWFMKNSWTSVADEENSMVINLDELAHAPYKVYV